MQCFQRNQIRPTYRICWTAWRSRGSRQGSTATEFAIALPLLLLLAIACCDFGRIIQYRQVVANAARTGAHTGATKQFTEYSAVDWEQRVRESVSSELASLSSLDESANEVSVSTSVDLDGIKRVVVEVSIPFETLVHWPVLPSDVTLFHHAEFRQFR
ncbi:TadE/TadG family type IV pilus assembly protein [Neorhodopirellula lusitana]|uniref:TadE/TadG family type IV pilus assembly protein n=1 Tax=Neorhodopirellula lusitana TaxID=445327 RepID=UPI00384AA9A9